MCYVMCFGKCNGQVHIPGGICPSLNLISDQEGINVGKIWGFFEDIGAYQTYRVTLLYLQLQGIHMYHRKAMFC